MTLNRNVAVNAAKDEIDVSLEENMLTNQGEIERRVAAPWSWGVRTIEIASTLSMSGSQGSREVGDDMKK